MQDGIRVVALLRCTVFFLRDRWRGQVMDIHICIDVCACVHVCHTHTAFCIPYNYNSVSLNGIENVTCGSHPGVSDMSEERSRCLLDIFRLLMCRHLHDTSIQPLSLHSIFYVSFSCPLTLEVLIDSFHNSNDNINIMKR